MFPGFFLYHQSAWARGLLFSPPHPQGSLLSTLCLFHSLGYRMIPSLSAHQGPFSSPNASLPSFILCNEAEMRLGTIGKASPPSGDGPDGGH